MWGWDIVFNRNRGIVNTSSGLDKVLNHYWGIVEISSSMDITLVIIFMDIILNLASSMCTC